MNPRLYQAMDLLYMPLLDLQQHLKTEFESNPFLELAESDDPDLQEKQEVNLGGIVRDVKKIQTKRTGDLMAYLTIEDIYSTVEVIVFPIVKVSAAASPVLVMVMASAALTAPVIFSDSLPV